MGSLGQTMRPRFTKHDIILTDADPVPLPAQRTFFSVLICCWQASAFIDECLDSLLSQTFPSWEALVLDDASTDDTLTRIKAKVGQDPRFRIYQNDTRRTALLNLIHLIQEAKGDYVAILDGDDLFSCPEALDMIFAVYNDAPSVMATSGSYMRIPDGGRGHCRAPDPLEPWWLCWCFGHTLTWRRDLSIASFKEEPRAYLDPETGHPYRSTYDLALYFPVVARAEALGGRVAHIETINYKYRRHENCDDMTNLGLQSSCAQKISFYWAMQMNERERQAAR